MTVRITVQIDGRWHTLPVHEVEYDLPDGKTRRCWAPEWDALQRAVEDEAERVEAQEERLTDALVCMTNAIHPPGTRSRGRRTARRVREGDDEMTPADLLLDDADPDFDAPANNKPAPLELEVEFNRSLPHDTRRVYCVVEYDDLDGCTIAWAGDEDGHPVQLNDDEKELAVALALRWP